MTNNSTMTADITAYLDGTDPDEVAAAAIRLDWQAFLNHQITREEYEETLVMSPEEIMAERDKHYRREKEITVQ